MRRVSFDYRTSANKMSPRPNRATQIINVVAYNSTSPARTVNLAKNVTPNELSQSFQSPAWTINQSANVAQFTNSTSLFPFSDNFELQPSITNLRLNFETRVLKGSFEVNAYRVECKIISLSFRNKWPHRWDWLKTDVREWVRIACLFCFCRSSDAEIWSVNDLSGRGGSFDVGFSSGPATGLRICYPTITLALEADSRTSRNDLNLCYEPLRRSLRPFS